MTNISEILKGLESEQYKQLMYAFEQGFCQIIVYEPKKFVAVNLSNVENIDLVNQEGAWSCGRIR